MEILMSISTDTENQAELEHGILTQCIIQATGERRFNGQVMSNLLLKMNSKLNGINPTLKREFRPLRVLQ
ncbi:GL22597 [Drosophila persimilis]|uniref:GL22597 n=1 Tax=Drosophila persimilis TaxID=7234 RepID=B4H1E3_DROPE|nr:GL22597 [Drosophila persimilis]